MSVSRRRIQLECPQCGARNNCGPDELLARLQQVGVLRRAKAPDWDLLVELLPSAAAKMRCAACGNAGLNPIPAERESVDDFSDEQWGMARACRRCGKSISAERLDALPDAQLCVACQQAGDPEDAPPPEFCSHCGAVMELRQVASGVVRYELTCTECGRR